VFDLAAFTIASPKGASRFFAATLSPSNNATGSRSEIATVKRLTFGVPIASARERPGLIQRS